MARRLIGIVLAGAVLLASPQSADAQQVCGPFGYFCHNPGANSPFSFTGPVDHPFIQDLLDALNGFDPSQFHRGGYPPIRTPRPDWPQSPDRPGTSVAEPGTFLLLATGLLGMGYVAWIRREEEWEEDA